MSVSTKRVVDLSHVLREDMPQYAPWGTELKLDPLVTYEEHGLRCRLLHMPIHLGTHLDAPSHFIEDGATMDQVPVDALVGPALCVSLDLPGDTAIEPSHLEAACEGAQPGDALLIHTGWASRMEDPSYLHHPYLSEATADWIVQRGFRLVGMDTITPELPGPMRPENYACPVHKTLLGAEVLILENLVLDEVGNKRFTLVTGALSILDGDGAPARVLAVFDA